MPSFIYKLLLRQLIKTNSYNRLYLGYTLLRFYNFTFNINRTRLYSLYKF